MIDFKKIEQLLFKLDKFGVEISSVTGAIKIGELYDKELDYNYWANCIYPPISENEVDELEYEIERKIPDDYKMFLSRFANGISVMNRLYLYGKRYNNRRDNLEFSYQPFNLISLNTYMCPLHWNSDMIAIGEYEICNDVEDVMYRVVMSNIPTRHRVRLCNKQDYTQTLREWSSLENMLLELIPEIYSIFEKNGGFIPPSDK